LAVRSKIGSMSSARFFTSVLVSWCLCTHGHSTLNVVGEEVSQSFSAIPAVWNAYLPNFGRPKLSNKALLDRESYNIQPSFNGRMVMEPGAYNGTRSLGCSELPATPQVEGLALFVERGLCSFREKATNAFNAGFKALVVANSVPGLSKVPDMSSPGGKEEDQRVELPALRNWLLTAPKLTIQVIDSPRRPYLGAFQDDGFGVRLVQVK
ncbi:unnamed protein product, partial [Effrenium voratum]